MTIEERLNRIEHFSAVADEQRRKDRETDRALWRDTQRQLNDLTLKLADLGDRVAEIAEESRAEDRRLAGRMEEADRQSRARDQELRDRIEAMISAMGGYIREHPPTAESPDRDSERTARTRQHQARSTTAILEKA